MDPAICLPGIGLHLNTALNLSNMPLTINPPLLPEQTSPATVISGSETALYGSEASTHVNDYSSQKTMPNADKSDQKSHKKKRLVNICLSYSLSLEFYFIDGDIWE